MRALRQFHAKVCWVMIGVHITASCVLLLLPQGNCCQTLARCDIAKQSLSSKRNVLPP